MEILLMALQGLITILVGYIGVKLKKRESEKEAERKEAEAIREGIRAVLRDRIIQAYNHFRAKGVISVAQLDNISNMYLAYHNLGGNGVVTDVYKKLLRIPHEMGDDD